MENYRKLSFNYHQIPSLSFLLQISGLLCAFVSELQEAKTKACTFVSSLVKVQGLNMTFLVLTGMLNLVGLGQCFPPLQTVIGSLCLASALDVENTQSMSFAVKSISWVKKKYGGMLRLVRGSPDFLAKLDSTVMLLHFWTDKP